MARPATPGNPRTDPNLLTEVIEYITLCGGNCAIAESANGYLKENINHMGLENVIKKYEVEVIDLDLEDTITVLAEDEEHYIPKYLSNYGTRIAMDEHRGEFLFNDILVSNDGPELDLYVLKNYFSHLEIPKYLKRIYKDFLL